MIVQIITEQLNMGNSRLRRRWMGKVPWEEDEGDVAGVFGVAQSREVSNFEWGIAV